MKRLTWQAGPSAVWLHWQRSCSFGFLRFSPSGTIFGLAICETVSVPQSAQGRPNFGPGGGRFFGNSALNICRNALIVFAVKDAWFEKNLNEYNDKSRLLIIGSQVRALVRPPSSLRKPHVSDTTPNRAFLRGFPATHFSDLVSEGVCAFWWRFLAPCLCIQKFRSRRPGLSAKFDRTCIRNSDFWATAIRHFGSLDLRQHYPELQQLSD
jgi:hypothetical protein